MQFIFWAVSVFVLIVFFPSWANFFYGMATGAAVITLVVAVFGKN
jgi:hypothetical protein